MRSVYCLNPAEAFSKALFMEANAASMPASNVTTPIRWSDAVQHIFVPPGPEDLTLASRQTQGGQDLDRGLRTSQHLVATTATRKIGAARGSSRGVGQRDAAVSAALTASLFGALVVPRSGAIDKCFPHFVRRVRAIAELIALRKALRPANDIDGGPIVSSIDHGP